ncbi:SDR family oxidoreductase [Luteirhabdus pelagi]|uniref:SDR family oxidoreductase n=1 Tax=Luteirhabdus pelagi TaxID=2792783 RepID=UPI00193A081D|nr:SDR family oxidoreductase [Luteirhabdus pelagi]
MKENIEEKVVIITGASSGLGETTARHISDLGAKVVLAARRSDRIEKLAKEINDKGGNAIFVPTDVTKEDQVKKLINDTIDEFGQIDVLLNNAGLMQQSPLESQKTDEWDNMIDVNVKGVLYGIAAVLPQMKKQKSGHIINVSSVAGHKVTPSGSVYCATKHAVRVISEGLRQEVTPYNLRTTIISPGAVDTELPEHITHEESAEGMKQYYKEHAISPDSFARAVAYAISQPNDVDINEILFRPTSQEL